LFAVPSSRRLSGSGSNAKIPDPDLIARSDQDILGFDIAVDDVPVVDILQPVGYLQDNGQDAGNWLREAQRERPPGGSPRGVVHRQERCATLPAKIQRPHDMPVPVQDVASMFDPFIYDPACN